MRNLHLSKNLCSLRMAAAFSSIRAACDLEGRERVVRVGERDGDGCVLRGERIDCILNIE